MAKAIRSSFAKMGVAAKELLVQELANLGEQAIQYAFRWGFTTAPRVKDKEGRYVGDGKWHNVMGNLHDSFGSAVYVDGQLRRDTVRFVDSELWSKGKERSGKDHLQGRSRLWEYLESIHPKRGKNEPVLVCVAAMYYTKFLEKGTHRGRYKIQVISGARDYVNRHWHEIVPKVYAKLGLKKPMAKVVRGDIRPLNY